MIESQMSECANSLVVFSKSPVLGTRVMISVKAKAKNRRVKRCWEFFFKLLVVG